MTFGLHFVPSWHITKLKGDICILKQENDGEENKSSETFNSTFHITLSVLYAKLIIMQQKKISLNIASQTVMPKPVCLDNLSVSLPSDADCKEILHEK